MTGPEYERHPVVQNIRDLSDILESFPVPFSEKDFTRIHIFMHKTSLIIVPGKKDTQSQIYLINGPEFTAKAVRDWLVDIGVSTLFIEPGSPWENGYAESFIGKFGNELLNGEIFYTLLEAKVITANWRREYNQLRPHSSLGCRPPTPAAVLRSVAYLISLTLQFLHISSASSIIGPNIIPSLSLIQCMNFHFLIL